MIIDGNLTPKKAMDMARAGNLKEAQQLEKAWTDEIAASGKDHCPCRSACIHHGNCFECVQIHRGHRDHLPFCLWDMVNERIEKLSLLTEGSFLKYRPSCCEDCASCKDKEK